MRPLYTGQGPGTGRSAWLRALWRRRTEAFELYCSALDTDPAHAAAANGLAVMVLDKQVTVMWNASPSLSGTVQIATSLSYNSTLEPGTSTLFGFLGTGAGSRPSTVECVPA